MNEKKKIRIATSWLDGCSGCHMSFLDMDERLLPIADQVELVYSPYVDLKEIPDNIDVALVEGAIGNEDDLKKLLKLREKSKLLVAFGDCAITSNVSGMRNPFGANSILQRVYVEAGPTVAKTPTQGLPALLPKSLPLQEYVKVDYFIPGCPPHADLIFTIVSDLLAGRAPDSNLRTRFG